MQKISLTRSLHLGRSLVSVNKKERLNLLHFSKVEKEFRMKTWSILENEIHLRVNSIM